MPTNQAVFNPGAQWHYPGEFDITAAGAVLTTTGSQRLPDATTVARTGTGTYVVTLPGSFNRTMFRLASYTDPAGNSGAGVPVLGQASVTNIAAGAADATGGSTTAITIVTTASNATGTVAADLAEGTISFLMIFQKNKI